MTNEEIKRESQYQATQMYLNYLANQEIMLDYYEYCPWLKDFDRDLLTKHKNMVASLKRNAFKAYRFLEKYDDQEIAIKSFHDFVRFHECVHKCILQGGTKYAQVLDEIDQIFIKHGLKEEV
jgi:hypothetical protein